MAERGKMSARKQIRNLLILIGCAVFTAIFVALGLLHVYGPTGSYEARYLLFSPKYFQLPESEDVELNDRGSFPFIFDKIEYSYYDTEKQQWETRPVDKAKYEKFYALISSDGSLIDPPLEVLRRFDASHNASLVLSGRLKGPGGTPLPKIFQEVEFAPSGDDYRLELQDPKKPSQWIYFKHPGIAQKAFDVFK